MQTCFPAPWQQRSQGRGWGRGMKMILGVAGCSLPSTACGPAAGPFPASTTALCLWGGGGGIMKRSSRRTFQQHLHT